MSVQGHRVCVRKLLGMIAILFLTQATWSGRTWGDGSAMNEVTTSCSMCHGIDLLAQQRLTEAQWQGVVDKMIGWGAVVPDDRKVPVIQVLTERFSLETPPYMPAEITAAAALEKVSPVPDPDLPGGNKANGEKLYTQSCAACHGPEAKGGLGLALADKPIVDQPAQFDRIVREGRRSMPPLSHLDEQDIADVLAYLRGLSG